MLLVKSVIAHRDRRGNNRARKAYKDELIEILVSKKVAKRIKISL